MNGAQPHPRPLEGSRRGLDEKPDHAGQEQRPIGGEPGGKAERPPVAVEGRGEDRPGEQPGGIDVPRDVEERHGEEDHHHLGGVVGIRGEKRPGQDREAQGAAKGGRESRRFQDARLHLGRRADRLGQQAANCPLRPQHREGYPKRRAHDDRHEHHQLQLRSAVAACSVGALQDPQL